MQKINIQIITAAILAIGGMVLLFCGVYIDPEGEISDSLLIAFGEVATFSGALFGIDAAYSKKLWLITNSIEKNRRAKPSEVHSTSASPDAGTKHSSSKPQKPSKTPTTSSPPSSIK